MQLTINVDSDGVVYDMVGEMIREMLRRTGRRYERPEGWWITDEWGIDEKTLFSLWTYPLAFRQGFPVPGAIEGLNALLDAGHNVRIITAKHGNDEVGKQSLVDMLGFYQDHDLMGRLDFVFTQGDKTDYPAQVVVDDKPDLGWTQGGAVNILFDQPWNRTDLENVARVGEESNFFDMVLYRANGWDDVLELVEQMGGGIIRDKSPVVV